MVINGEVPNKNLLLRNEVMKLMSKSTLNKQAIITKAPDTDKKYLILFLPIKEKKKINILMMLKKKKNYIKKFMMIIQKL